MCLKSLVGLHVLEGWATVVFPMGGYVLCAGEERLGSTVSFPFCEVHPSN